MFWDSPGITGGEGRFEISHKQDIALSPGRVAPEEIDVEIVGIGDIVSLVFFSAGLRVAVDDAKVEFNVCVHSFWG